jgi:hypothetical protein
MGRGPQRNGWREGLREREETAKKCVVAAANLEIYPVRRAAVSGVAESAEEKRVAAGQGTNYFNCRS